MPDGTRGVARNTNDLLPYVGLLTALFRKSVPRYCAVELIIWRGIKGSDAEVSNTIGFWPLLGLVFSFKGTSFHLTDNIGKIVD